MRNIEMTIRQAEVLVDMLDQGYVDKECRELIDRMRKVFGLIRKRGERKPTSDEYCIDCHDRSAEVKLRECPFKAIQYGIIERVYLCKRCEFKRQRMTIKQ